MDQQRAVRNVSLDAHPHELSVIVRYQLDSPDPEMRLKTHMKIIGLTELSGDVDISWLSSVVMERCPLIPDTKVKDLEQILYYLLKRSSTARSHSASSTDGSLPSSASSVKASMEKVEEYLDMLYEETTEKNRGLAMMYELSKNPANLKSLAENERVVSALGRMLKDEWKTNLELARLVLSIFLQFSSFQSTQHVVIEQKLGTLCMAAMEFELSRGDEWLKQMKNGDEKVVKKCEVALRREHALLGVCVSLLLNQAEDCTVEIKMLRKGLLPLLSRCLVHACQPSLSPFLLLPVLQFLLKLSTMEENKVGLEKENIAQRVVSLFPIVDILIRRTALSLLFNLSLFPQTRNLLVSSSLVQHIAPLIRDDEKALHLFYQLTLCDDAKALLPFTDSIQTLMVDVLSSSPSTVAKAALLNGCLDKRSAQIAACPRGEGLDALVRIALREGDLLAAKIVRNMAIHDGTTQEFLMKWTRDLLEVAMKDGFSLEEAKTARAVEFLAICALSSTVDWPRLSTEVGFVQWLQDTVGKRIKSEHEPLLLQQVLVASRVACTCEGGKSLLAALPSLLNLLHSLQEDDELVTQLLFLFNCLLRHRSVAITLLTQQHAIPAYVMDLMHDNNPKVNEQANEAMRLIGDLSDEWSTRFRTEKFRFYNAQWLEMVEKGEEEEEEQEEFDDDLRERFDEGIVYLDDDFLSDEEGTQLF